MKPKLGLAALAWAALWGWTALAAPVHVLVWLDGAAATAGGPQAWRAIAAWGLRSRWVGDAGAALQHAPDGCGPAVLHALLANRPPHPPQDLLWSVCRVRGGGSNLGRLCQAGRRFGLPCDVLWRPRLAELSPPAIVHLSAGHFVLLERRDARCAEVLDPSCGRVRVPFLALQARASGAVLQVFPTAFRPPSSEMP